MSWRTPIHIGGRQVITTNPWSTTLAAIPVVKGERVRRLEMDFYCASSEAASNLDQPLLFRYVGVYYPVNWGATLGAGGAITTAELDAALYKSLLPQAGDYSDPNPSGEGEARDAMFGVSAKTLFTHHELGSPVPVGKDSLDNTDAHMVSRWTWHFNLNARVQTNGVILLGVQNPAMPAQTDFGVAEIDSSMEAEAVANAYLRRVPDAGASTLIAKGSELFWQGDTYVEADTFKHEVFKAYLFCKARIQRSTLIQTKAR